jgi:hypothetical protein|tara:strand:- start:2815 stop:3771 length:957 start_codon:yes stop_codon:yes gene_type:complete
MNNRQLLKPLPREHLLSLLARWFDLSGRNDFLHTVKPITSNARNLKPSTIWQAVYADLLVQYQEQYNWKKILTEHTLIPYYAPFLNLYRKNLFTKEVPNLITEKISPLQQQLIFHAQHWRWCPQCAVEDKLEFGTTYWHTLHQIPSVRTCYRHEVPLISNCPACGFSYKSFQKHWLPPFEPQCRSCGSGIESLTEPLTCFEKKLHSISLELQRSGMDIDKESLLSPIRKKLGADSFGTSLSVRQRNELNKLQTAFNAWIPNEILEYYFSHKPDYLLKPSNKILRLFHIARGNRETPPICTILVLIFFELENHLRPIDK